MQRIVSWGLGLAGLIPFYAAMVAKWMSLEIFGLQASTVFVGYGVVILAFLSGSVWGRAQVSESKTAPQVLIASNVVALWAFVALLIGTEAISLLLLLAGFIFVLLVEHYGERLINSDYMKMRAILTGLVVLAHLGMLV